MKMHQNVAFSTKNFKISEEGGTHRNTSCTCAGSFKWHWVVSISKNVADFS